MKRTCIVGAGLLAAGLGLGTSPAIAQVSLGADVAFNNQYIWRGLTLANKFAIQPDLYVTVPVGPLSLTGGGWGTIEPSSYDNLTDDISERGGTAGLGEFDWWAEAGFDVGIASLAAGVTGYIYPGDCTAPPNPSNCLSSASNTTELYAKASFGVFLSPKVAWWLDVDKIKGSYLEFSVSQEFPLGPASLTLGGLMGLDEGQDCELVSPNVYSADCTATTSWNFAENGITHGDISAAATFGLGPISITPNVHMIITNDPATKIESPTNTNESIKWLFGATISWGHEFGGSGEGGGDTEKE
jgi:Bacterial protein of unknown function (Gcw_chp)